MKSSPAVRGVNNRRFAVKPLRARIPASLVDSREIAVRASGAECFAAVRRIGGNTGWYAYDRLWQLRGWLDRLCGGPGLCRGRAHADQLRVGDTVDCWRVVRFEPNRKLMLAAEMRLPGRAWLQFEVVQQGHVSRIRQTTIFEPAGVVGRAYWHITHPLHRLVFGGMLDGLVRAVIDEGRNQNNAGASKRPSPAAGEDHSRFE